MRETFYDILLLLYHLFKSLVISKLILKSINLSVGSKSSPSFCVLHIVSNFVLTMLFICQVKLQKLGFMDVCVTYLHKLEAY